MMIEQGGVYSLGPLNKRIWVTRGDQVLEFQWLTISRDRNVAAPVRRTLMIRAESSLYAAAGAN
jgi:hypothetical protein